MASFPWPGQDRLATATTALFCAACYAIGVLPTAFGELQAPAAKIAVRTEGSEDVLGGSNQQSAHVGVSSLGDSRLGVLIAGLISARYQAQGRTDFPAGAEAIRGFQGEDIAQGGESPADSAEQLGLWVPILAERLALFVEFMDLMGERAGGFEDGEQSRA